jgi:hypothetical protein
MHLLFPPFPSFLSLSLCLFCIHRNHSLESCPPDNNFKRSERGHLQLVTACKTSRDRRRIGGGHLSDRCVSHRNLIPLLHIVDRQGSQTIHSRTPTGHPSDRRPTSTSYSTIPRLLRLDALPLRTEPALQRCPTCSGGTTTTRLRPPRTDTTPPPRSAKALMVPVSVSVPHSSTSRQRSSGDTSRQRVTSSTAVSSSLVHPHPLLQGPHTPSQGWKRDNPPLT